MKNQFGLELEEFCKFIGLTRDNIASYERGMEPKLNAIMKIAEAYQVSIDNLLHKELVLRLGWPEQFTQGAGKVTVRDNQHQESYSNTLQEGIPMVSAEAFAGLSNNTFSIEAKEIQDRYVVLVFENIDFMIRVKGSSMNPKYNSGDVVACRILKQCPFI